MMRRAGSAAALVAWAVAVPLFFAIIGVFGELAAILSTLAAAAGSTAIWLRHGGSPSHDLDQGHVR